MVSKNIQEVPEDDGFNSVIMMPDIDEDIPLPKNAADAMPELSVDEEIKMRASTIKLISDLKGDNIEPDKNDIREATRLAEEMISNPTLRPEFAQYPNETMAFLAGLVAQSNCMIVKDLAEFKMYVVNNLVRLAEGAKNDKDKIAALKAIGEVDGVDAFKRKSEITHISKSMEEVEDSLLKTLASIEGKIIDVEEVVDEE